MSFDHVQTVKDHIAISNSNLPEELKQDILDKMPAVVWHGAFINDLIAEEVKYVDGFATMPLEAKIDRYNDFLQTVLSKVEEEIKTWNELRNDLHEVKSSSHIRHIVHVETYRKAPDGTLIQPWDGDGIYRKKGESWVLDDDFRREVLSPHHLGGQISEVLRWGEGHIPW